MTNHLEKLEQWALPEQYTRRELNTLYREIPLKDSTFRTLRKYLLAMANLYGIISLGKAWDVLHKLSPALVTEEEFFAFAEIARHEEEPTYSIVGADEQYKNAPETPLRDRELVHLAYIEDTGLYGEVKILQRSKPYNIPGKVKDLLCYADDDYLEDTAENLAMLRFLQTYYQLTEEEAKILLLDIRDNIRFDLATVSDIVSFLIHTGHSFRADADVKQFAKVFMPYYNQTRMACNRGYSPDELSAMRPRQPQAPTFMDLYGHKAAPQPAKNQPVKVTKVGRNDPCPCGSGKKYKRCCGR